MNQCFSTILFFSTSITIHPSASVEEKIDAMVGALKKEQAAEVT